jgi:hypothetical protein
MDGTHPFSQPAPTAPPPEEAVWTEGHVPTPPITSAELDALERLLGEDLIRLLAR